MALNVISIIGLLSIIAFTDVIITQSTAQTEQINMSCATDKECIDKLKSCNVYCYHEDLNALMGGFSEYNEQMQVQGRCVEMTYVDNGVYGYCD